MYFTEFKEIEYLVFSGLDVFYLLCFGTPGPLIQGSKIGAILIFHIDFPVT